MALPDFGYRLCCHAPPSLKFCAANDNISLP